jgi:Enolase C-terminal domain-like
VSWFEEPVSSDDLEGLRPLRERAPAGMDIAAAEYGYDLFYFRRMLEAGAVDVLQADATRCAGAGLSRRRILQAKSSGAGEVTATGRSLRGRERDSGRGSPSMGSQQSKSWLNRECSQCRYPDKGGGPCPSPTSGCTATS